MALSGTAKWALAGLLVAAVAAVAGLPPACRAIQEMRSPKLVTRVFYSPYAFPPVCPDRTRPASTAEPDFKALWLASVENHGKKTAEDASVLFPDSALLRVAWVQRPGEAPERQEGALVRLGKVGPERSVSIFAWGESFPNATQDREVAVQFTDGPPKKVQAEPILKGLIFHPPPKSPCPSSPDVIQADKTPPTVAVPVPPTTPPAKRPNPRVTTAPTTTLPPATPPPPGALEVLASPPAQIYIDGKPMGESPTTRCWILPSGRRYELEVVPTQKTLGLPSRKGSVAVEKGEKTYVEIDLTKPGAKIVPNQIDGATCPNAR